MQSISKFFKSLSLALLGLAASGLLAGTAVAADQWALGTSSVGSGPYRWGATIAEVVNANQSSVAVHAQGTAGFNENIILVNEGTIPLALSDAMSAAAAYQGLPPFDQFSGGLKNIRWVAGVIVGVGHCFARADAGISSINDIRGKAWNLNVRSSATRTINDMLLDAAGIKDIKPFELATGEVFDALQNRVIAGSCNILAANAAQLQSLAASTKFTLLPVEGELYQRFATRVHQGIIPVTIPAGTYPGQDKDVSTFGLVTPLLVNASMDDELVYQFTKAFWDNLPTLNKSGAFRSLKLNQQMAFGGGIVPVHGGAARYYRENVPKAD